MKTLLALAACLGLSFLLCYPLGAGDKDKGGKDDKFDMAKLVGKWTYVSGEKSGTKLDVDELKKQAVTITKDSWTLKGGDMTFVMKYEIDAKKTPATIKLTMTESPFGPGAVAQGIVEIKGNELRICYNADSKAAPKTFATKEGDKNHLFVLKRNK